MLHASQYGLLPFVVWRDLSFLQIAEAARTLLEKLVTHSRCRACTVQDEPFQTLLFTCSRRFSPFCRNIYHYHFKGLLHLTQKNAKWEINLELMISQDSQLCIIKIISIIFGKQFNLISIVKPRSICRGWNRSSLVTSFIIAIIFFWKYMTLQQLYYFQLLFTLVAFATSQRLTYHLGSIL